MHLHITLALLLATTLCPHLGHANAMLKTSETDLDVDVDVDDYWLYQTIVRSTIVVAEHVALEITRFVVLEVKKIVLYPVRQLKAAVADIEARKQESEECVAAESLRVANTIETATLDFYGCGRKAITNSVQMVLDTKRAVLQLTLDGYKVTKQALHCRNLKSSTLKRICKTKLAVMATLYLINAQSSIRTLMRLRQRAPALAYDAEDCTESATERALFDFGLINENIDTCIYNTLH